MFSNKNVLSIQCSNTQNEQYALFCDDRSLYHGNDAEGFSRLAVLPNIALHNWPVKIYYHFPYICVTERYGLNAATVNIMDGRMYEFSRENYHCDVSSYSIGFFEREARVFLIHQTQWNRLDITDLETGELLTPREIIYRKTGEPETMQTGAICGTVPKYEESNYIDYFHSLLHVSPDGRHFLSNGWVWHPSDKIICFETECFLSKYEPCGEDLGYYGGYAWDRPCAFVGNDMIVIAADKSVITLEDGADEASVKEPPAYHQLLFYTLDEIKTKTYTFTGYENIDSMPLAYSHRADCDVFAFDKCGEITCGELHYDTGTQHLIALSEKGAFELSLAGEILHSNAEIKLSLSNWAQRRNDTQATEYTDWLQNWQYDAVRRLFYRFHQGKIETKRL